MIRVNPVVACHRDPTRQGQGLAEPISLPRGSPGRHFDLVEHDPVHAGTSGVGKISCLFPALIGQVELEQAHSLGQQWQDLWGSPNYAVYWDDVAHLEASLINCVPTPPPPRLLVGRCDCICSEEHRGGEHERADHAPIDIHLLHHDAPRLGQAKRQGNEYERGDRDVLACFFQGSFGDIGHEVQAVQRHGW